MSYADWRGRLLEAVDESLHPAAWIDGRVADGTARFWENEGGAILAEIKRYPSGVLEVHGLVAAGNLDSIMALVPYAEQWGLNCGCTRATIQSSPAWARLMAGAGYQVEQILIAKEF